MINQKGQKFMMKIEFKPGNLTKVYIFDRKGKSLDFVELKKIGI